MSESSGGSVEVNDPEALYTAISEAVSEVLIGNETPVEGLTIALLTDSHVLLEGVPGVAKTTIANAFSQALGIDYSRIQMTPDVLPADITGSYIYREATNEFELRKGPIFSNVVVADEINRATPKTQSALLEAMQERQVTIEGETLMLPEPFLVIATQNPIEMEGTFELAEAQRDRFALKYRINLPDRDTESLLLDQFDSDPAIGPEIVDAVVDAETLHQIKTHVDDIYVSEPIREYILDIVQESRRNQNIDHGGSPRATLTFLNAGKARAAINGRGYVIPDDIKTLVEPVLRHRLVRNTDARLSERSTDDILTEIIESVSAPGMDTSFEPPAASTEDGST